MARLERDAKRAALLGSPLFAAMRPEELDEILKFASERRVRRGQTIVPARRQRFVDDGRCCAGRIRISSISGDGKEVTLNVINPGEIIGEFALLDGKPRSDDARGEPRRRCCWWSNGDISCRSWHATRT